MVMSVVLYVAVGAALFALFYGLRVVARAYWKYRGKMLVTCPETKSPVGVEVDAGTAAMSTLVGEQSLRLKECTRWPERQSCGQECLRQIESSPENCLVRTILADWFSGKACAYCRKEFGEIQWHDHKPALLGPDQVTVEWSEIPVETLLHVLSTHKPVCWNCHIAETFRRTHPELVTDRPPRRGRLI